MSEKNKKKKKEKPYKVKTKRTGLFCRFVRGFMRIFLRKPKLISLSDGDIEQKAIFVMNHAGARGPMIFDLYFPVRTSPWGAHEMCGNYRERWNYLYHVFYRQKKHWGRARSFIVATLFAIISKSIYDSIGLIGTYQDVRLMKTMRNSMTALDAGVGIVIFPEDSSEGYLDKPKAFHRGFIKLAKIYYGKTGIDAPVYGVYYSKKKNTFTVDKPMYINELLKSEKSEGEIAELFLKNNHAMYSGGE